MTSTARAAAPTTTAQPPNAWHRAFRDVTREHAFEPLDIEGRIPPELDGTLYRNGPGLFGSHGRRYGHWFDGDGCVSAVRFGGGRAQGASRVVVSRQLAEERAAGRMLYGGFGTVQPGLLNRLRGRYKNSANTSILPWNGRLYALMEAALPTELDPDDLTTIGEADFGGVVPRAFSAHPHAVASRGSLYNFGVRYGRKVVLDLFELTAGGARRMGEVPLSGATMIHDFIATDNHLVVFAPPLRLRVGRLLLGRGAVADNLAWRADLATEVLVIPIDDPSAYARFEVEPFLQWHFANAFERDGDIVVDYVRYRNWDSNTWLTDLLHGRSVEVTDGTLHRAVVSARRRTLETEQLWARPCEFPRVAPAIEGRAYRYSYVAAHAAQSAPRGLQDCVAKVDVTTGAATELRFGDGQYTSEPVFVPRDGSTAEDDGYLLALVYDAARDTSHVAVVDARDLEAGPVARVHFDHHVPFTFHGNWQPGR